MFDCIIQQTNKGHSLGIQMTKKTSIFIWFKIESNFNDLEGKKDITIFGQYHGKISNVRLSWVSSVGLGENAYYKED